MQMEVRLYVHIGLLIDSYRLTGRKEGGTLVPTTVVDVNNVLFIYSMYLFY
jgi:hypothetical protein